MNNSCTQCGSDNTQKLSVVFESGTSCIDTKSQHVAVAFTGSAAAPILGSSSQKGLQQSQLAAKHAPPPRGTPIKTLLAAIILGPIVSGVIAFGYGVVRHFAGVEGNPFGHGEIVFWSVLGVVVVNALSSCAAMHKYNRHEYPGLIAEWSATWLCHKCGECFIPEEGPSGSTQDHLIHRGTNSPRSLPELNVSRSSKNPLGGPGSSRNSKHRMASREDAAAQPSTIWSDPTTSTDNYISKSVSNIILGPACVVVVGAILYFGTPPESDAEQHGELLEQNRIAQAERDIISASKRAAKLTTAIPEQKASEVEQPPAAPIVETTRSTQSKFVTESLAGFKKGIPLLADGKFLAETKPWGQHHQWTMGGNMLRWEDRGADNTIEFALVFVGIPPEDSEKQLLGIGLAYKVLALATGDSMTLLDFVDKFLKPAAKVSTKGESLNLDIQGLHVSFKIGKLSNGSETLLMGIGNEKRTEQSAK